MILVRNKYQPAYCNEVVECCAEGHSLTAFAGRIGVARNTIYDWIKAHPEFDAACQLARAKSAVFWEQRLIEISKGKPGNVTAAIFALKNRVADEWREKVDVVHDAKDGGALVVTWAKPVEASAVAEPPAVH